MAQITIVQQNDGQNASGWPISLMVKKDYALSFACVRCKEIPRVCMNDDDGDIICDKCSKDMDNVHQNKALQKMINKLKTKCFSLSQDPSYNVNNETEGINIVATKIKDQCDWNGMLKDYDNHSKQCKHLIIECNHCKSFKCKRKLLDKHIAVCADVKINCPLSCGSVLLRKNMDNHLEKDCVEQLINCSNDDCKVEIKRKDFVNHVNNECFGRIVECKFKKYGCNIKDIKANQLVKHMDEYKFQHLSNKFDFVTNKLMDKNTSLQQQLNALSDENQTLRKVLNDGNASLQQQLSALSDGTKDKRKQLELQLMDKNKSLQQQLNALSDETKTLRKVSNDGNTSLQKQLNEQNQVVDVLQSQLKNVLDEMDEKKTEKIKIIYYHPKGIQNHSRQKVCGSQQHLSNEMERFHPGGLLVSRGRYSCCNARGTDVGLWMVMLDDQQLQHQRQQRQGCRTRHKCCKDENNNAAKPNLYYPCCNSTNDAGCYQCCKTADKTAQGCKTMIITNY